MRAYECTGVRRYEKNNRPIAELLERGFYIIENMELGNPLLERTSPQIRQELYAEEMFGSAALVVVGEPTSEQHKNAILDRVTQGNV